MKFLDSMSLHLHAWGIEKQALQATVTFFNYKPYDGRSLDRDSPHGLNEKVIWNTTSYSRKVSIRFQMCSQRQCVSRYFSEFPESTTIKITVKFNVLLTILPQ